MVKKNVPYHWVVEHLDRNETHKANNTSNMYITLKTPFYHATNIPGRSHTGHNIIIIII